MNALAQVMAVDHAAQGIRVSCILPGPVFTPMVQAGGLTPEQRELRAKGNLLGIEGTGWDVGRAAVSLASPEAHWITGQLLCVDGGVTLLSPPRGFGAVADTSPRSPCLRPTARQQGPVSSAGSYW